jgi:hypothetical protein
MMRSMKSMMSTIPPSPRDVASYAPLAAPRLVRGADGGERGVGVEVSNGGGTGRAALCGAACGGAGEADEDARGDAKEDEDMVEDAPSSAVVERQRLTAHTPRDPTRTLCGTPRPSDNA